MCIFSLRVQMFNWQVFVDYICLVLIIELYYSNYPIYIIIKGIALNIILL